MSNQIPKNFLQLSTDDIIDMYVHKQMSAPAIAKIFNCSEAGIRKILRRNGYTLRAKTFYTKYQLNADYFEQIDTEEKAYWLGFLYADGYLNEEHNTLTLRLQERDGYLVKQFNASLGSNRPIFFIKAPVPTQQNQIGLRVKSKKMTANLVRLGLKQNKSLTLQFPTLEQVPQYLIRHFIRGYFDGDGCLSFQKMGAGYPCIVICVSKDFGEKLKTFCLESAEVNLAWRKRQSKIYALHMSGRLQCLRFLDFIYRDASIYMQRKYDRYILCKNHIPLGRWPKQLRRI